MNLLQYWVAVWGSLVKRCVIFLRVGDGGRKQLSTAIAYDLSQALYVYLKPNMNVEVQPLPYESYTTPLDDLPLIVLVHDIFSFGKGVGQLNLYVFLLAFLVFDLILSFCMKFHLGF